jgi:hypothetical protein
MEKPGREGGEISPRLLRASETPFSPLASVQIALISGDCPPSLFQLASRAYGF